MTQKPESIRIDPPLLFTDFGVGCQAKANQATGSTSVANLEELNRLVLYRTYSPFLYEAGKRSKRTTLSLPSVLPFDIDHTLPLEEARAAIIGSSLSFHLSTTRNHQKEKVTLGGQSKPPCDRFRVLLPIDRPLANEGEYKKLFGLFNHTLFRGVADQLEWGRLFFPSSECVGYNFDLPRIPVDEMLASFDFFDDDVGSGLYDGVKPLHFYRKGPNHGCLSRRARAFIEGRLGTENWHHNFIYTALDLKSQGYTISEAREYLRGVTGYLDNTDEFQLVDIYEKRKPLREFMSSPGLSPKAVGGGGGAFASQNNPAPTTLISSAGLVSSRKGGGSGKVPEHVLIDYALSWAEGEFTLHVNSDATHYFKIKSVEGKELELVGNEDVLIRFYSAKLRESRGIVSYYNPNTNETHYATPKPETLARYFSNYAPDLGSMPEPFLFSGEDEELWTYQRLNFSVSKGKHPTWDEFVRRIPCALSRQYFMTWVATCFDKGNHGRLSLWLWGPKGQDGKSSVMNAIGRIFGQAAKSINASALREPRFLNHALFNKRFIYYPDCLNSKFVLTEQFRQYTGKDPVPVEIKGGRMFDYPMRAKLAVASNILPFTTSSSAVLSRILIIPIVQADKSLRTTNFEDDLVSEFGAFLHSCRAVAKVVMKEGRDEFDIDERSASFEVMSRAIYESEVEFDSFFNQNFRYEPDSPESEWVSGAELFRRIKDARFASLYARDEFIKFLKNRYDIDCEKVSGSRFAYRGLVLIDKNVPPEF